MLRMTIALAVTLFCTTAFALAADGSGRTCSLNRAFECMSTGGCKEWTIQEMALPRFIRVDLDAKTIVSLDRSTQRPPTPIAAIERLEGMTVLYGSETRGWSMAIGDDSGALTLSISGDEEGYLVYGSCINP